MEKIFFILYLNEKLYFITVKRELPQLAKLTFYVFSLRIKIFKRFIFDTQVNRRKNVHDLLQYKSTLNTTKCQDNSF